MTLTLRQYSGTFTFLQGNITMIIIIACMSLSLRCRSSSSSDSLSLTSFLSVSTSLWNSVSVPVSLALSSSRWSVPLQWALLSSNIMIYSSQIARTFYHHQCVHLRCTMHYHHLNAYSFLSLVFVEMRFHLIVLRLDSTSLSFRWLRHAHLNPVLAFLAYRFSYDTIDDTYCNSISCLLLAGRQNLSLNLGLSIWIWQN